MKCEGTLQVLKNELSFVQKGGYRAPLGWRAPLVFEDSPTCSKRRCTGCPETDCVLMTFVPPQWRYERVPCRHIPLNDAGESLDSLYRTETIEEIERILENWLVENIHQLEQPREPREKISGRQLLPQAA
jgi:hypothetical protein